MSFTDRQVHIALPNRKAMVKEISLTHKTVTLAEVIVPERNGNFVMEWPDLDHNYTRKDLAFLGVNVSGRTENIKESWDPKELALKLMEKMPDDFAGYLSINRPDFFCVTDGYDTGTMSPEPGDGLIRHKLTPKPVVRGEWFYGPKSERGPLKNVILRRPYALERCWISSRGRAVVSLDWLKEFLKNHGEQIADPFRWYDPEKKYKYNTTARTVEETSGQEVILGDE